MGTQIEWANAALDKVGQSPITSFEDGNKAANLVKRRFDAVRDAELRRRRWSFAIARAQLAADSEAPAFGYGHAYPLPTDCLRVIAVGDFDHGPGLADYGSGGDAGAPYRIEGRAILYGSVGATAAALNLRYIRSVSDTSLWDATFGEAFACRLAIELCEPLAGSTSKKQELRDEYREAVAEAVRANALELPPQQLADDTWIMGRVR